MPLAGIEPYEAVAENPADVKAAGRLAKLYDAILEANPGWAGGAHTHELNLFMARLLFCFFAEDTSIFEKALFSKTIFSMTREDGGDTALVLQTLFTAMDRAEDARDDLPEFARKFPYVNGGLFAGCSLIPVFSARARRLLRECGELSWQEINPDIFGSMIQGVVEPGLRGDMGMHYTSVPNIMKVLQPLFLLSLELDLEEARDSEPKLRKLLARLYKIRIFDPACGSGNFLIIAYRELRKLENRVFVRLQEITGTAPLPLTGIRLDHFYGIELADFAAETAKLSLWIAEYQANKVFRGVFGDAPAALPLRAGGNITHGNATRVDWAKVGPPAAGSEIYIVGNPPYLGNSQQSAVQKDDLRVVFADNDDAYKKLDYVACWFMKAARYCTSLSGSFAFVATSSICQGEQVALLWPPILEKMLEVGFAHHPFKWQNNAAKNAGVTCIIVGIRPISKANKFIIKGEHSRLVQNISPYLIDMDNTIVRRRPEPLSAIQAMDTGNKPTDGGNLMLNSTERNELLLLHPESQTLLRRFYGSKEYIQGIERWCLWITDALLDLAKSIPHVQKRLEKVAEFRNASTKESTQARADRPHQFEQIRHKNEFAIVVPRHFSENRHYLTVGIVDGENSIISDAAAALYNPPGYLLSILSSRLHAVWTATVGGRIKTDFRYSNTLVYNTFPIPDLTAAQQSELEDHAGEILMAREAHPGQTIAWLYDPETMPSNVLKAHRALDDTLERMYIGRPFRNDTERLEHLFKLYSQMVEGGQRALPAKQLVTLDQVA